MTLIWVYKWPDGKSRQPGQLQQELNIENLSKGCELVITYTITENGNDHQRSIFLMDIPCFFLL